MYDLMNRRSLLELLHRTDPNGCYLDDDRDFEGLDRLTKGDAILAMLTLDEQAIEIEGERPMTNEEEKRERDFRIRFPNFDRDNPSLSQEQRKNIRDVRTCVSCGSTHWPKLVDAKPKSALCDSCKLDLTCLVDPGIIEGGTTNVQA